VSGLPRDESGRAGREVSERSRGAERDDVKVVLIDHETRGVAATTNATARDRRARSIATEDATDDVWAN